jgi:hypothetical protein
MPAPGGPQSRSTRDRLRIEVRRERQLAAAVDAAAARLTTAVRQREAAVSIHDRVVAERRAAVGAALGEYLERAGVSVERAAVIFDRSKTEITRLLRERHNPASQPAPNEGGDR